MTQGTAIPVETVDRIIALRASGATITAIAEAVGVSHNTVARYSRVKPDPSGRDRVLAAVAASGPLNVPDLAKRVGLDPHTVRHLVHSLHRADLLDYREVRGRPTNIVARSMGDLRLHVLDDMGREVAGALDDFGNVTGPAREERVAQTNGEPDPYVEPTPAQYQYPAIAAEVKRREMLTTAADLLEAAGEIDLAVAALAAIDGTAITNEALRLYARLTGEDARIDPDAHEPRGA